MMTYATKSAISLAGGLLGLAGLGLVPETAQADPMADLDGCQDCGTEAAAAETEPAPVPSAVVALAPTPVAGPALTPDLAAAPAPQTAPEPLPDMAALTAAAPVSTQNQAVAAAAKISQPAPALPSAPQPEPQFAPKPTPTAASAAVTPEAAEIATPPSSETTAALPPRPAPQAAPVPAEGQPTASQLAASGTAADLLGDAPTLAQSSPASADQIREDLQVDPLASRSTLTPSYPPSPNAGIPSAFGADWGDVFASLTLSGADRVRPEADGSLSVGFGLGDAQSLAGVEVAYNVLSLRNFGDNGSVDVKVHRDIYTGERTQVAAAVGWNNIVNHGTNVAGSESSPYGVATAAYLLRPEAENNPMPLTTTLGVGGGNFSQGDGGVGVIAGVGLQVNRRLSLNTAWSGVGLNVGASFVPVPSIPLTVNALYGDVTNNTEAGSVAVLSVGYGFNFGPRF